MSTTVYIGLGGNIGNIFSILDQAVKKISQEEGIKDLSVSQFYQTSPVGNLYQNDFINAVCCFNTCLEPKQLLRKMQMIEQSLGKVPKAKEAPRPIDIDILFYGSLCHRDIELEVPHPSWKKRLFVLIPLLDLTSEIEVSSQQGLQRFVLRDLIQELKDSRQSVCLLDKKSLLE